MCLMVPTAKSKGILWFSKKECLMTYFFNLRKHLNLPIDANLQLLLRANTSLYVNNRFSFYEETNI